MPAERHGPTRAALARIQVRAGMPCSGLRPPNADRLSSTTTDPAQLLLEVVSERTGYPAEMLDPDLDLEADLSKLLKDVA